MTLFTRIISSLAVVSFCVASAAHAEVAVIVHPHAAQSPGLAEVANIYHGKDKSMTAIDLENWGPTRTSFYNQVANKNESQMRSYWSGLIFTGKGQPPASVADDAAMIQRVASDSNAIGYVDSASVTDEVKVIFTLP